MKPDTHYCFSTSTLCDRPIESCLVPRYLLIHKQGRDKLNSTHSERRSHLKIYGTILPIYFIWNDMGKDSGYPPELDG
ncbi:hypothetical protein NDI49_30855 [Trichocoleus sp. ST-U3]